MAQPLSFPILMMGRRERRMLKWLHALPICGKCFLEGNGLDSSVVVA